MTESFFPKFELWIFWRYFKVFECDWSVFQNWIEQKIDLWTVQQINVEKKLHKCLQSGYIRTSHFNYLEKVNWMKWLKFSWNYFSYVSEVLQIINIESGSNCETLMWPQHHKIQILFISFRHFVPSAFVQS